MRRPDRRDGRWGRRGVHQESRPSKVLLWAGRRRPARPRRMHLAGVSSCRPSELSPSDLGRQPLAFPSVSGSFEGRDLLFRSRVYPPDAFERGD